MGTTPVERYRDERIAKLRATQKSIKKQYVRRSDVRYLISHEVGQRNWQIYDFESSLPLTELKWYMQMPHWIQEMPEITDLSELDNKLPLQIKVPTKIMKVAYFLSDTPVKNTLIALPAIIALWGMWISNSPLATETLSQLFIFYAGLVWWFWKRFHTVYLVDWIRSLSVPFVSWKMYGTPFYWYSLLRDKEHISRVRDINYMRTETLDSEIEILENEARIEQWFDAVYRKWQIQLINNSKALKKQNVIQEGFWKIKEQLGWGFKYSTSSIDIGNYPWLLDISRTATIIMTIIALVIDIAMMLVFITILGVSILVVFWLSQATHWIEIAGALCSASFSIGLIRIIQRQIDVVELDDSFEKHRQKRSSYPVTRFDAAFLPRFGIWLGSFDDNLVSLYRRIRAFRIGLSYEEYMKTLDSFETAFNKGYRQSRRRTKEIEKNGESTSTVVPTF